MKSFSSHLGKGVILGIVGAAMCSSVSLATSPVPCLQLEKDTLKEYAKKYDLVAAVRIISREKIHKPIVYKRNWNFIAKYEDFEGPEIYQYSVDVIEYYRWRGGDPPNRIKIAVTPLFSFKDNPRGVLLIGAHYVEGSLIAEKNISKGARSILENSVARVGLCGIQDYDEKKAVLAGQLQKF
ncbi:hypothetical protein [Labrys okinawensis]|uniref:hypothetical protein n=1 Tax=Labrys okinawensis TaxID=346911 RepID=UPI0011B1CA4B|nr:hypothetical protein [Labrys okinawensis]